MKFNYDKIADAAYLYLNKGKIKKTIEISDNVLLDVDTKGKIIGIEILDFYYNQKAHKKVVHKCNNFKTVFA